jgi:hypothetical protein
MEPRSMPSSTDGGTKPGHRATQRLGSAEQHRIGQSTACSMWHAPQTEVPQPDRPAGKPDGTAE